MAKEHSSRPLEDAEVEEPLNKQIYNEEPSVVARPINSNLSYDSEQDAEHLIAMVGSAIKNIDEKLENKPLVKKKQEKSQMGSKKPQPTKKKL